MPLKVYSYQTLLKVERFLACYSTHELTLRINQHTLNVNMAALTWWLDLQALKIFLWISTGLCKLQMFCFLTWTERSAGASFGSAPAAQHICLGPSQDHLGWGQGGWVVPAVLPGTLLSKFNLILLHCVTTANITFHVKFYFLIVMLRQLLLIKWTAAGPLRFSNLWHQCLFFYSVFTFLFDCCNVWHFELYK